MIEIFDIAQGSDAWRSLRLGMPTASRFADILAQGKGLTRRKYLYELAGEIMTGETNETFNSMHMERGKLMEAEARDCYAATTGTELRRVGFVRNSAAGVGKGVGCSPDSLIGDDGALEIKTKMPHLLIETIERDEFPSEHKAQCMGVLWVTGRQWIDISCYWPKMPLFIKRAVRDEDYINKLAFSVSQFSKDLDELVASLRGRISQGGTNGPGDTSQIPATAECSGESRPIAAGVL
jgi:predicted phage-related endonuclease